MVIDRLELSRIGCFLERAFDFSEGLNLIYGENRTGKSTLVYALFFSLFGSHLNPLLQVKDMVTKGHITGETRLGFRNPTGGYRLHQSTGRLPRLFQWQDGAPAGAEPWTPVNLNDPAAIKNYVPIAEETAALGSFFRESEIIYFLQETPKYNKTLIQNLLGMDDVLIVKSRFKKAKNRAREYREAVRGAAPRKETDPLSLELARSRLESAEAEIQDLDRRYQAALAETGSDPTVFKLLLKQRDEKEQQREKLLAMKARKPPREQLQSQCAAIDEKLESCQPGQPIEALQRMQGAMAEKAQTIRKRIRHVESLAGDTPCPLCGLPVPPERRAELTGKYADLLAETEKRRQEAESQVDACMAVVKNREALTQERERLQREIQELLDVEIRIQELEDTLKALARDIKPFEIRDMDLQETQHHYGEMERIEKRKAAVQEEVVRQRVIIHQHEDQLKRLAENQKELAIADRRLLVCRIAHQAVDEAIQAVGGTLMGKIRDSIRGWSHHFSYLSRFDIAVTETDLLPVIQASGYQYKLNQMSKSERLFLYLLLKLAIGDALGHLGIFVLDDPADGLDLKRKETLAYLLAEVARKRQVIITTNDKTFADLFAPARRIHLEDA